jgi:membrane protease YdiL (CAAX protease family)
MDETPDPPFLPDFWQSIRLLVLEFVAIAEVLPPFPEWARRGIIGIGFPDLVILVPIVEEELFRGLILGGYVRKDRPATAILLCGLVFAISYVLPWQFPEAFTGVHFFSWLTVETRSPVLPVVGHAFVNGVAWWMVVHPDTPADQNPTQQPSGFPA